MSTNAERRVAVITGGSQGIGAALVAAYRKRDFCVVATARSAWNKTDGNILVVAGDVRDRDTAKPVIGEGVARFGRVDTLVNNAGVFLAKPPTQCSEADYEVALGVNVAGFFHTTQLAVAKMEKRGCGHIVQIATTLTDQASSTRRTLRAASALAGAASLAPVALRTGLCKRRHDPFRIETSGDNPVGRYYVGQLYG